MLLPQPGGGPVEPAADLLQRDAGGRAKIAKTAKMACQEAAEGLLAVLAILAHIPETAFLRACCCCRAFASHSLIGLCLLENGRVDLVVCWQPPNGRA